MTLFHNVYASRNRYQLMFGARALVAVLGLLCGSVAVADMRERQDEAAFLARGGDYDTALAILAELRVEYPAEIALLYDEIVISVWAGNKGLALATADELVMDNTPLWVSAAVGKAARDLQRFDTAILWYESATRNNPADLDARLGLAMAHADAGQASDARAALKLTPPSVQKTTPVLLTSAYLFQREGMFIPAVNEYDRILAIEPNQSEALRGKIYALQELLLPVEALKMAQAHPGLMTDADMVRLEGDALALELRRAMQKPDEVYPYPAINLALAHIDDRLEQEPDGTPLAMQLRYDRVAGRTEALRTLEAINDYETMLEEGIEPPAYVHYAAARSYLARERPEEALQALETAEQLAPNNLEIQIEKFYAYISVSRYKEAIALADGLVDQLEPMIQEENSNVLKPNETRTRARIIASMGRAYADQLDEAQQMLVELLAEAPNNLSARYSLGNIYRYRGWEDRPLPEYSQVLTMDPQLLPARTSYAQAEIQRQEYPQANSELRAVQPLHPGHKSVMDLNEAWLLYRSWQLLVDVQWGDSSGDTFGSDQHEVNAWLFTQPVKDNFRFYLRTFDNYAEFVDGNDSRRRAAVGTEYRKGVWTARGEANWNRTDSGDVGFAGRVDYRINDQWSAGGALEIDSYATQLRADRVGIKSDIVTGDVRYGRDERYTAGAGVGIQHYDDGNTQLALLGDSSLRFINRFKYKLDGLANFSITTNSDGDATVYFAPESRAEVNVGVQNIWQQYRRYDAALTHRLSALAGINNQKNYGSDGIWTLAYELEWSINESVDLVGGASRGRRYYDGDPEDQTFFNLGLNARF
ncbi:MAG: poly-beta-1,6 N-acetyl-D-glucosamine export porin PgaA [Gammaproteobacteria bacterium]|nr:MAG: poly-beta-1,6 N-acetyl-D-glucosamine export porin PgaA [Gammaproteobacteria bacterium]